MEINQFTAGKCVRIENSADHHAARGPVSRSLRRDKMRRTIIKKGGMSAPEIVSELN